MKKNIALLIVASLMLNGCALLNKSSTIEEKLADVHRLSYAAASMGTQIAIVQNPSWKPQFEQAYAQLNVLVESGAVTGTFLRSFIAQLQVKELKSETARIVIENATFLYDTVAGTKVNIETSPYINAAARGIRDGMKVALGK